RLGKAELLGWGGEAAHIGHRHQMAQLAQIQQFRSCIAHGYRFHHIHLLDLLPVAADPGVMTTDRHRTENTDTPASSAPSDATPSGGSGTINRRLVVVMALASGLVVANSYYTQPVVSIIAETFSASTTSVGLVVTASQIGYAVGLAFLVPLGDLIERRRLLTGVLSVTALCLVAMAIAPSWQVLGAAALLVGVSSVVGQVLVPFAASLAAEHERGRVIGNVMTGLLL